MSQMSDALMEQAGQRYRIFQRYHNSHFGAPLKGRLLEFGCGAGRFLISAYRDGLDVHGVEVDENRRRQFLANAEKYEPGVADRITLYPGRLLPFPSNHFDGCYSFFVFEHVTDPQTSLRELVRTLKPGGTLILFADDTRNAWDGHAKVPWPPYMPREFAAAYLEGLGLAKHADFVTSAVVYISAPVIADILTTLGMEVVYQNAAPDRDPMLAGLYVTNDAEARKLGEAVKKIAPYESPKENLTIFARKR